MQAIDLHGRQTHVQKYMLAIFCAMSFILYLDRVNLAAAAGPIKDELGLSNITLGIAFSAFGYTYAIFQIIGGWFADRMGAKKTLIVCGSIWVGGNYRDRLHQRPDVAGAGALAAGYRRGRGIAGAGAGDCQLVSAQGSRFRAGHHAFFLASRQCRGAAGGGVADRLAFVARGVRDCRGADFSVDLVWIFYYKDNPREHPGINETELTFLPEYDKTTASGADQTPWKRSCAACRRPSSCISVRSGPIPCSSAGPDLLHECLSP